LPVALTARGYRVGVLTPAYGLFAQLPGARRRAELSVDFAGAEHTVGLYELAGQPAAVQHYVLDHPRFAPHGPGRIYTDDPGEGPFATDASKFAFFCACSAVAVLKKALPVPDVLHLHDWQAALVLLLREFEPRYAALKKLRTVFTIHNLAMQGVRPLSGYDSALESWFPDLDYDAKIVTDPRWADCVNPMAVGIRLADALNTVSPTYAREILLPNDPQHGFSGGEGLEADLIAASNAGRLSGILNGCMYPPKKMTDKAGWRQILDVLRAEVTQWIARESRLSSAHYLADKRLAKLGPDRPRVLLTSIGRTTAQKVRLFRERTASGLSALEDILAMLGPDGLFVMVGSGDPDYERYLSEMSGRHEQFLFLNAYSDAVAELLFAGGDLFLMPSSFEPCGISQMLAMRAGQLCVVHGVGGLRDTVTDGVNGFVFDGATPTAQADAFVATVGYALEVRNSSIGRWQRMQQAAASARFSWDESAAAYEKSVYGFDNA
jgi:starch synthase